MSIGCRHGGCVWGIHAVADVAAFEWPFTCFSFFLLLHAFHCLNLITFEALSAKCVHDNNNVSYNRQNCLQLSGGWTSFILLSSIWFPNVLRKRGSVQVTNLAFSSQTSVLKFIPYSDLKAQFYDSQMVQATVLCQFLFYYTFILKLICIRINPTAMSPKIAVLCKRGARKPNVSGFRMVDGVQFTVLAI